MSENTENEFFDRKVMQANFSALLYLLTEQQALIGKLLQALIENGSLTSHQLERITDVAGGEDGLIPTYTQLYNRFAHYYLRTKQVLAENENFDEALKSALEKLEKEERDKDNE